MRSRCAGSTSGACRYGTRLGYEIARRIPDRVRTLTLESVVPVTFNWPSTGARDLDAALNAVIDDCLADAACASAYPDLRRDVDAAFSRLQSRPIAVNVVDPATGAPARVELSWMDLAYAVRGILYGDGSRLPALFRDAARGNYDAFGQAYVTRARTLDEQIAAGLLFGVYCAEDLPFVDWTAAQQAAAGTRIGTYLLDQYRRGCEVWPRGSDSRRLPRHDARRGADVDVQRPPRSGDAAAHGRGSGALCRAPAVDLEVRGHGVDGTPSAACRNLSSRLHDRGGCGRASTPAA